MRPVAGNMATGTPAGGLWMWVGQSPRCVRIFSMTSGCSIHAMIRLAPAHWGHTRGSTSNTCVMSRAHARFASEGDSSLDSTLAGVAPLRLPALPPTDVTVSRLYRVPGI